MAEHYERLEPPRPVWVKHRGDGQWYPGVSLGRRYPLWPQKRWVEFEVEYLTNSSEMYRRTVGDLYVKTRRPMDEPDKDAPCAQCDTSRRDCDQREQTQWPPYCCPRCRRSEKRYALHLRK